jgi:hypothetical protein
MEFVSFQLADFVTGAAIPNGKCVVYLSGSSTLAALFDVNGASIANPAIASSLAQVGFAAADGLYDYQPQYPDGTAAGPKIPRQRLFDLSQIEKLVTPQQYGALGDGVHDDTSAINAAAAAAVAPGMPGVVFFPTPPVFYRCDGQFNAESTLGLLLRGTGARVEPLTDMPRCAIVYTGTASSFFKAGKSHGLTIKELAIQINSSFFTGDIFTLDNDGAGGAVSYSTCIVDAFIGGRTSSARHARSCINASGAVELIVLRTEFGWADQQIIGRHSGSTQPFSNAVKISFCRFNGANNHAINVFAAEQWDIGTNVFEPLFDGTTAGAISDVLVGGSSRGSHYGVSIHNNGFWDATTGGTWIDMLVQGTSIKDNFVSLGSAATFAHFHGGAGLKLSGQIVLGSAGATFITDTDVVMTQFDDDGTNVIASGITYNGNPSGFVSCDRSFHDVSARQLTVTADAGGAGGFVHARKAVASSGVFGGGFWADRNDNVNYRGYGVFSYLDPTMSKECIALTVAAATTAPTDTSQIRMLITQDGAMVVPEAAAASVNAPASGWQAIFLDTSDHKLKRKDSSGTVTILA